MGPSSGDEPGADRLPTAVVALAALAGAITVAPILAYPLGRDQGAFAAVADAIGRGGLPYRDAWDIKPPAIYYLFQLAFTVFGRSMLAARLLDVLCTLASAGTLYVLGKRLFGRYPALAGVLLYLGLYGLGFDYWATTQCEGFAALPLSLAALALLAAEDRRNSTYAVVCGALVGAAVLLKLTLGVFLLLPLIAALSSREEPVRPRLARSGGYLLGCAAAVCAVCAVFLGAGGLGEMLYVLFDWNIHYAAIRPSGNVAMAVAAETFRFLLGGKYLFLQLTGALALLGAGHVVFGRRDGRGRWIVTAWAGVMLLSVWGQLKLHPYHWLALLPPMGLLAGHGFGITVRALRRAAGGRAGRALAGVVPALLALSLAYGWTAHYRHQIAYAAGRLPQPRYFRHFGAYGDGDFSFLADAQVAGFLRRATEPGTPVYIWGFEPLVYYLADRPPASRFITLQPLVSPWSPPAWREELIRDLNRQAPACIMVLHNDVFPWVTGTTRDSAEQLDHFPELAELIARDYRLEQRIEHFDIYLRRPQSDR